ncbi:MAG: dephospho-CoA kinase [Saccharofermentanales bacterium]
MFVIGITGGIGCGKSEAARICREYGLTVIDADEISKTVSSCNGAAIPEIAEAFGKKFITEEGSIDRKMMSELVFKNKRSLDLLSSIVHKYVVDEIRIRVEEFKQKKYKAIVLDVPIPVKNGFLDLCDQVWVIWADDDLRIKRLNQRGMKTIDAKRRILSQMTKEEYEAVADKIIMNNGTISSLKEQVTDLLNEELHLRGIKI